MSFSVLLLLSFVGTGLADSSLHPAVHPPIPHPVPSPHPHLAPHPYKQPYCDPSAPPTCAYNGTYFCLEDKDYPQFDIKNAIEADYLFPRKYADVADQSANDLVDYVNREQEEYFDYSFYSGASTGPSPFDLTHWAGPEGYICPSHVTYAMPKRAKNVEGHWRVIVNHVHYYTQTARIETCLYPESACRALVPCYKSHCTQKFVYHRLLSFDPCDPYKGLFIDVYRFPSACSCHVSPY